MPVCFYVLCLELFLANSQFKSWRKVGSSFRGGAQNAGLENMVPGVKSSAGVSGKLLTWLVPCWGYGLWCLIVVFSGWLLALTLCCSLGGVL